MRVLLLCATIVCSISAQTYLFLGLNDVCSKDRPDIWRCTSLSDCPILKETIENGQRPDVCSFKGREPIICCPTSAKATPTNRPTSQSSTQSSTGPTPMATTTKQPFKQTTQFNVNNEEGPVWGTVSSTKSSENKSIPITISVPANVHTTGAPTLSIKSRAEQKCEEYSKYVFQVVQTPTLLLNEKPKEHKTSECGIQTLVIGGIDARPKEFPHMALIGYGEKSKIAWLCGGSLISPKFVLSAAHCTKPNSRIASWVKLGDLDTSIDTDDARPVELGIVRRFNHPEYKSGQALYHDIALYELESEVKLGPYIRPICLHTSKNVDVNSALATGWGHLSWGGSSSSKLQFVNLTLVSHTKCNDEYGKKDYRVKLPNGIVDDAMLCAGGILGKDTCQGDSGGPLQILKKDIFCMYSQIGIVSFGKNCALRYPGVYTRVSHYVPWIESIVWPS